MSEPGKRTELIVGVFMLTGMLLLAGLVLQFGRFKEHFGGYYLITVVFDDASGLIKGSEVRMGGARIGRVAKLPELNEEVRVEVDLAVTDGIRIPEGSSFQINSATLLGDKLVVVIPPAPQTGGFIEPGSRIRGAGATGIEALQSQAETLGRDVLRILKDAEATLARVDAAVTEIQAASIQLSEALAKVNRSVLSDANLARIDRTMDNLATATAGWKDTSARIDPALGEAREAIAAVQSAARRAEKTMENADATIAAIKPAVRELPAAITAVRRTAGSAGDTFERMNRGEGMLGAFAADNAVALDFKAFMNNLRRHGVLLYRDDADAPQLPATPRRSAIRGRP